MTLTKRNVRLTIALVIGVVFSGLLLSLIFVQVPENNRDILKVLVGFVGGAFVTMVSYYFGDSDGSDGKE